MLAEILVVAACFVAVFCTELLVSLALCGWRVVLFMGRTVTLRALWITLIVAMVGFYHFFLFSARVSAELDQLKRDYKYEASEWLLERSYLEDKLEKCNRMH